MSRTARTKKARRPTEAIVGRVQPLELDQEGVVVATPRGPQILAAGVVGERVKIRPSRRVGEQARLSRVLEPSAHRCTPPCPLIARCGACTLQEMSYAAQLAEKTAALRRGIAGLRCPAERVSDVVGLPSPFGYRTKLLMASGGSLGELRFGLYRRSTLDLVPAEGCPVQHPLNLGVLAAARQVLDARRIAPSTDESGWLHAVGIRTDPRGGHSELTLAGRTTEPPDVADLVAQLAAIPSVHSVCATAVAKRSSYPLGSEMAVLAGSPRTPFTIGDQIFELSPGTFVQTSAAGGDLLAARVIELLPENLRCLADLYGGAGTFTRLSASRWERAVVVDESASASADLQHYLSSGHGPHLGSVTALTGRLETLLSDVTRRRPDVVLLDPPRHGCKPGVIPAVAAMRPAVVIYVACGFGSLLRDGHALLAAGYAIDRVEAVDIFPHTTHLEVIARFVRG